MAGWKIKNRMGSKGERNGFPVHAMRSFMVFLGTAGTMGCVLSALGISFESEILDIVIVFGCVLMTEAALWTGYHPLCAACEAGICLVFCLMKRKEAVYAASLLMDRWARLLAGGPAALAGTGGGATALSEAGDGSMPYSEAAAVPALSKAEGEMAAYGCAVCALMLTCVLVWLLGQKMRRLLPALFMTGIFPALFIYAGVVPGYAYISMLLLFWALLLFDADELMGPSFYALPLALAIFLGIFAAGVRRLPHDPIDFTRPMGTTAAITTVGGENHDPVTDAEDTDATLPNQDDPENADPGGDSDQVPDGRDKDGMKVPRQIARVLIAMLAILCAVLLFPVTREIRLRLRKKKTHGRNRNEAVIAEYGYMEKLSDYAGAKEDAAGEIWRRATEIGLKAKFSGETVSANELREMHRLASYYRHICMERVKGFRRFYGLYGLAL